MIYQKFFVDILLLFNGMILNYLYFHFYDSRYILRLSKFQKMLTVCLLALMFVFVYSDFGYCSYIFTSLLGFLFIRIFYHFEEKSEYITQWVFHAFRATPSSTESHLFHYLAPPNPLIRAVYTPSVVRCICRILSSTDLANWRCFFYARFKTNSWT